MRVTHRRRFVGPMASGLGRGAIKHMETPANLRGLGGHGIEECRAVRGRDIGEDDETHRGFGAAPARWATVREPCRLRAKPAAASFGGISA